MADWLEAQLLREMAQVKAPDSLWTRIQAERRERRNPPRVMLMLWPAVATVLLVASVDLFWQADRARGAMIRISDSDLAVAASPDSRFESDDPAVLGAWLKAKSGMDVSLICGGAAKIRLAGARLMHVKDELVAAISYDIGGKEGLLLVSKKGVVFERVSSNPADKRLVSWNGRNRSFTFTSPLAKNLDPSCRTCHLEGHGRS